MAKAAKCKHCGITTGRGKRHKPECKRPVKTSKKRKAAKKAESKESAPFDARVLRGMDVEELLAIREKVDKAIQGKAPQLKKRISAMQDTLKTIQGKT